MERRQALDLEQQVLAPAQELLLENIITVMIYGPDLKPRSSRKGQFRTFSASTSNLRNARQQVEERWFLDGLNIAFQCKYEGCAIDSGLGS